MKLTTRIGSWRLGLIIKPFFFRTLYVNGITSDVFDIPKGEHVIFWDFEETDINKIKKELKRVQKKYGLGRIDIYRSGFRSSYRAVCLDRVPLKDMVNIIMHTEGIDIAFVKWTLIRRSATIRITPKHDEPIFLVQSLKGNSDKLKSYAHALIFNKLFGVPIPEPHDGLTKIRWVCYETIDKKVFGE